MFGKRKKAIMGREDLVLDAFEAGIAHSVKHAVESETTGIALTQTEVSGATAGRTSRENVDEMYSRIFYNSISELADQLDDIESQIAHLNDQRSRTWRALEAVKAATRRLEEQDGVTEVKNLSE